jgi:hypothetical protein
MVSTLIRGLLTAFHSTSDFSDVFVVLLVQELAACPPFGSLPSSNLSHPVVYELAVQVQLVPVLVLELVSVLLLLVL